MLYPEKADLTREKRYALYHVHDGMGAVSAFISFSWQNGQQLLYQNFPLNDFLHKLFP